MNCLGLHRGPSDTHIHLKTTDGRWSGHVEELRLAADWTVAVPRHS